MSKINHEEQILIPDTFESCKQYLDEELLKTTKFVKHVIERTKIDFNPLFEFEDEDLADKYGRIELDQISYGRIGEYNCVYPTDQCFPNNSHRISSNVLDDYEAEYFKELYFQYIHNGPFGLFNIQNFSDFHIPKKTKFETLHVLYLCGGIATGKTTLMKHFSGFDNEISNFFRMKFSCGTSLPDKYFPIFIVLGLLLKLVHFNSNLSFGELVTGEATILINRSFLDHEHFWGLREEGSFILTKEFYDALFSRLATSEVYHKFFINLRLLHSLKKPFEIIAPYLRNDTVSKEIADIIGDSYDYGWPFADYRQLEKKYYTTQDKFKLFNFEQHLYIYNSIVLLNFKSFNIF